MMNKEIKAKWVSALKSGNYRQGQNQLKVEGKKNSRVRYCCLGVLCNIYKKDTGKGKWERASFIDTDGEYEQSELPGEVALWAGLKSTEPVVNTFIGEESLIALNDGDSELGKVSFKRIACLIDESL
tara:strand:- start:471 stop:851 length:381 start_codon:yes stop_codon:yes gene_type:complete